MKQRYQREPKKEELKKETHPPKKRNYNFIMYAFIAVVTMLCGSYALTETWTFNYKIPSIKKLYSLVYSLFTSFIRLLQKLS